MSRLFWDHLLKAASKRRGRKLPRQAIAPNQTNLWIALIERRAANPISGGERGGGTTLRDDVLGASHNAAGPSVRQVIRFRRALSRYFVYFLSAS